MLKPGKIGLAIIVGLMLNLFLLTSSILAQRVEYSNQSQIVKTVSENDRRLKANPDFQQAPTTPVNYQHLDLQCKCEGICLQHQDCTNGNCTEKQGCWFGDCSRYRHCNDWWCSRW